MVQFVCKRPTTWPTCERILVTDSEQSPPVPAVSLDSRLEIIQEISLALNSTMDPDELVDLVLDASIRYTGATTGSFILMQDGMLRIVAQRGLGTNVKEAVNLRIGEGVTGWVAEHGQPVLVPDVNKDDRYVKLKGHISSELAVPLVHKGSTIGVISVDSTRPDNFSEDDLQLLTIVGTLAAQVLENARAYEDLRRRSRHDETMLEISQLLGSSLRLEQLFSGLMDVLSRRCGMTRGLLVLVQQGNPEELAIEVAYGMTPEEIAKGRYQADEGIIGRVFRSARPVGVRDITEEPDFLGRTGAIVAKEQKVCFLACPIAIEGEAVGVFGATKVFPGEEQFGEDLAFLEILANTLARAVTIYRDVERERAQLLEENQLLKEELGTRYKFDNIVGTSPAMQKVFSIISSVAKTRSTVMIRGESGTGKELIAHAIHYNSPRSDRPFVRVNCAAIPENLLEAELFGHVKGAFTGAVADRKGKFELADNGTIFLDEIGDMSPLLQAKILRVLQEREIEVVGGGVVSVDVRILAATHQNLEESIQSGEFREDLYYRLNVVPIHVPPLRERPEDIRLLSAHFLEKFRVENGFDDLSLTPDAMRALLRYPWPGNVRELENLIERAAVLSETRTISCGDLPGLGGGDVALKGQVGGGGGVTSLNAAVDAYWDGRLEGGGPRPGRVWDDTLRVVENHLLDRALRETDGVQLRAAEVLGIHRNTLRKRLASRS